jgi:hypothetical protein
VRPIAAINSAPDDAERWPSSAEASTLLFSLEALARWRQHLALTMEEALPEPWGYLELLDPAGDSSPDEGYTDAPWALSAAGRAGHF